MSAQGQDLRYRAIALQKNASMCGRLGAHQHVGVGNLPWLARHRRKVHRRWHTRVAVYTWLTDLKLVIGHEKDSIKDEEKILLGSAEECLRRRRSSLRL